MCVCPLRGGEAERGLRLRGWPGALIFMLLIASKLPSPHVYLNRGCVVRDGVCGVGGCVGWKVGGGGEAGNSQILSFGCLVKM